MKFAYRYDAIAPARCHALEPGIEKERGARASLMESKSVNRVKSHRHVRESGGEPADKASLRRVRVDDTVALAAEELAQAEQSAEIPKRADRPADDVQTYDPQSFTANGLLHHRVRGENVDFPAFLS